AAGPDPGPAAGSRMELRLRRRCPRAGDLHQLPAQEARRPWAVAGAHGARRRLRAAAAPRLMSLRARLLVGMVVLVAAGLAVAAVATYEEQRSFLLNRLDQ